MRHGLAPPGTVGHTRPVSYGTPLDARSGVPLTRRRRDAGAMTTTGLSGGPAGPLTSPARTDGFGTGALRWWRRSAGAGVVALLALAFAALATGEDGTDRDSGFWALIVLACT